MRLANLALAATAASVAAPASAGPWKSIDRPEFVAVLPGEAKFEEKVQQTPIGDARLLMWSFEGKEANFAVSYVDYPAVAMEKAVPSAMLDGARDGAMANINGKLERDVPVFLDAGTPNEKWPGRDIEGLTPAGVKFRARLYLVANRLYQLVLVHPAAKPMVEEFRRMVAGFRLKSAGKTPAK